MRHLCNFPFVQNLKETKCLFLASYHVLCIFCHSCRVWSKLVDTNIKKGNGNTTKHNLNKLCCFKSKLTWTLTIARLTSKGALTFDHWENRDAWTGPELGTFTQALLEENSLPSAPIPFPSPEDGERYRSPSGTFPAGPGSRPTARWIEVWMTEE